MISCISEQTPTARKRHRCEECGGLIAPGQKYVRQFNTDGSDVWTYKAHGDCRAFSMNYRNKNLCWHDEWVPLHQLLEVEELAFWRGEYPHVVCRLELREQRRGAA